MTETLWITLAACVAAAAGAWLLRDARDKAAIAGTEARLQALQQQFSERGRELEHLRPTAPDRCARSCDLRLSAANRRGLIEAVTTPAAPGRNSIWARHS
jgi:hypothetical protein